MAGKMKPRALPQAMWYKKTNDLDLDASTGKVAVKVINHYGDEVMKVFAL